MRCFINIYSFHIQNLQLFPYSCVNLLFFCSENLPSLLNSPCSCANLHCSCSKVFACTQIHCSLLKYPVPQSISTLPLCATNLCASAHKFLCSLRFLQNDPIKIHQPVECTVRQRPRKLSLPPWVCSFYLWGGYCLIGFSRGTLHQDGSLKSRPQVGIVIVLLLTSNIIRILTPCCCTLLLPIYPFGSCR